MKVIVCGTRFKSKHEFMLFISGPASAVRSFLPETWSVSYKNTRVYPTGVSGAVRFILFKLQILSIVYRLFLAV